MLRWLGVLALIVLAIGAVAALWARSLALRALPQLDGQLPVAGLTAPVSVLRDAQGVPHITAANEHDLLFAQGYVTAQDRLWQLDVSRRWAAGEAAEIFGASQLDHDREQRILGIRQVAERAAAALDSTERTRWQAYADGVNAYINARRGSLSVEFRLLGYQPKPWTIVDSFLCGANLAQALNHYEYLQILAREAVTQKLGPELADDLFPNSSWRDHPPGQDVTPLASTTAAHATQHELIARSQSATDAANLATEAQSFADALVPGSNNWVVSGAHTVSGRPLLSNDMHLQNTIPNTWYEAQLTLQPAGAAAPTFDVAGFTVPGMPYVIAGHNRRIAWGFTNLGPTVEDVYIENVNDHGEYQTPAGWQPLRRRHEVIHVGKDVDVAFDVASTRHGPIISSLLPGENRSLALHWTLLDESAPMTSPFFAIDSAQNWDQFRKAFSIFSVPGQNVVYADVDGHIGYQATGRIPIRASGDGSLPVSGADDAHEWTGTIPFDELPRVFDPPSGIIATANGRIAPDQYKYMISNEWGGPYRTQRIYQLLRSRIEAGKKFAAQDMLAIQTDIYSDLDRFCAQKFAYAVDHSQIATARAREAAQLMREWDGRETVDSAAPTIVAATERRLWRLLLEPKLGAAPPATLATGGTVPRLGSGWQEYTWFMSGVAMENLLTQRPQRWLPAGVATWDDLLVRAVEQAITPTDAPGSAPKSLADWRYGNVHTIQISHPVLGRIPFLKAGTGVWPLAGGGNTVKQVARAFGPSQRATTDLGDLDKSYLNVVTGESGEFMSPYFIDQWKAYYEGHSFTFPFTESAVKSAAQHTLTLTPP